MANGRYIDGYGYVLIRQPDHPHANSKGYVREHVLIVERVLGHVLPVGTIVHHFDENTQHNTNNNLIVCNDIAYHKLLHRRADAYHATGDANARKCAYCKKWDRISNLIVRNYWTRKQANNTQAFHQVCYNDYQRSSYHRRITCVIMHT